MIDTGMSPDAYREQLADDLSAIEKILVGLDSRGWAAPVPACPGWTVTDLITHLGGVHRLVVAAIADPGRSPGRLVAPDLPDLATWFAAGGRQLSAALAIGPQAPAWTFAGAEATVGFWQRRQAMENAIHRLDLEQAMGIDRPVPSRLAADGVSEVLEVMLALRVAAGMVTLPDWAIELRAADAGASWLLGSGQVVGSASADAPTLFAALWKRVPMSTLALDGDVEAAEGMLRLPLTP